MDEGFWRNKWRANELGWHRETANPALVEHLPALRLADGARLFLPLCGKTRDVGWLLEHGFRVVGAELVESAVEQLFADLGIEPTVASSGRATRHSAPGVDILAGDLFDLDAATIGEVDAVYDRAALIAMPRDRRAAYAAQVSSLSGRAPQLLVTCVYDEAMMAGPPFSVPGEEVAALCGDYAVERLADTEVEGGLKGVCPAREQVWRLSTR